MNKPYKDHVTPEQILMDGWSRGFDPSQTQDELKQMGHTRTIQEIREHWAILEADMEAYYASFHTT